MPKRLSDVTHLYERTSKDLEDAQDDLTSATERARVKVDAAAQARHRAHDDLYRWVREHPNVVVVAGDWGYHFDRGQISRMKIVWAHHEWVKDPDSTPSPTYRVPPADLMEMTAAAEAKLTAMAIAWGNVEREEDDDEGIKQYDIDGNLIESRAGEAVPKLIVSSVDPDEDTAMDKVRAEWEEPNSQPIDALDALADID